MSFGGSPQAPNPNAVVGEQQSLNLQAAQQQNANNMFNQSTPFGSLNWASDPNAPGGYSANVALTPQQQQLLNTQTASQQNLGGAANQLSSQFGSLYGTPPDLLGQSGQVAGQLNKWNQQYLQPIFQQQQSNTDAQLQNQGLTPGSTAYNNAENLLARNQGDVTNQYLSMNQPTAFSEVSQQYQMPLQTQAALMGNASPQGPSFQPTPQAQIQPPNYTGVAEQNYQQQLAANTAAQSGMFGIPTALAGGWARGGFPGASSLGGMFGSAGAAGAPLSASDAALLAGMPLGL